MATLIGGAPRPESVDGTSMCVGIVAAQWHDEIVSVLLRGAIDALKQAGVDPSNIRIVRVPGSFELPVAAMHLASLDTIDGVIALGVVIRGDTAHFEYVSSPVAHGLMEVALDTGKPCMFGVLTVDTVDQAWDRAGGKHGNKGAEAANGLLQTIRSLRQI